MICTFLRAVQYTEKLHRSSGKRLFLPHFALNKSCLKTEPSLRWLHQQEKTVRPRCILGGTPKTIWTQGQSPQREKEDSSKQVSVHSPRGETAISTSQKVKEAGRDFTYLIVVLVGISITGGLFYALFKELFSSSSPNKIYGKALEKCRSHPEVISVFGEPVKGYGETTRRGRRQHVSFIEYVKDGLKHMRVKFYIEGSEPGKRGTVHLEVKEVCGPWWADAILSAPLRKVQTLSPLVLAATWGGPGAPALPMGNVGLYWSLGTNAFNLLGPFNTSCVCLTRNKSKGSPTLKGTGTDLI